jgi:hypothetical protein
VLAVATKKKSRPSINVLSSSEARPRRYLVEPVGDATAVELILKTAMPFVVIDRH